MSRGTYLRKRPQGWVFRRAIPQDLQARFGLREIVRSLAHVAQSRAPYESRVLGFACEDLFMEARANERLTRDQLRLFAKAVGASKRDKFAAWTAREPPRDRRAAYEDYRDVTVTSIQAAVEGRSIFEPAHIADLARNADMPDEVTTAAMPFLQQIVARATGAYCADLAEGLRPQSSSLFQRFFGHRDDREFDAAVEQFRRLGALDPTPYLGDAQAPDSRSGCGTGYDELGKVQAASPAERLEGGTQPSTDAVEPTQVEADAPDGRHRENTPEVSSLPFASDDLHAEGGSSASTLTIAGADIRFSTHWDTFVEEKIGLGEWSSTRRAELAGTLRLALRLLGDVSILALSRDEATAFRSRFLRLPSDHKNMWIDGATGKQRTFDELMDHVAELKRTGPVEIVDPKTWNKQCCNYKSFIIYMKATCDAVKNIDNVFEHLSVKISKTSAVVKLERAMAPTIALEVLFDTEVWRGRRSIYHLRGRGLLVVRDSLYWIPLMEVCLGLRREEAAQLRVRHITIKFKILGMDLFAADIRVKTDEASRRWIPLSQALIDLGFIDCLVAGRDPDELLFPELSDDNAHRSFGDSFGRRFLNYVKHVDVDFTHAASSAIDVATLSSTEAAALIEREKHRLVAEFREKVSNHAIRHWFKTIAENTAGVKTLFVDAIMGHSGEQNSEGSSRYFKEAFVHNLKTTIDAIPMPFDPLELRAIAEGSERDHPFLLQARRRG